MTPIRIIAIAAIFISTMVGWFILGGSLSFRSKEADDRLGRRVEDNWGGEHIQKPPEFYYIETWTETTTETSVTAAGQPVSTFKKTLHSRKVEFDPLATAVDVDLEVDHRQKGLLWYSVYAVKLAGEYRIVNPSAKSEEIHVRFVFPSANSMVDDFVFTIDGTDVTDEPSVEKASDDYPVSASPGFIDTKVSLNPGEEKHVRIGYRSQGTGAWQYNFGEKTQRIRNFAMRINTHFKEYDIPAFCISPTDRKETEDGWLLTWKYNDVISNIKIGVDMPKKLNPGPVAERISFFAPVSLLFFFTVLIIIGAVRDRNIHPMNYFFLAAAFFAFHLLFAYLVDHLALSTSFVIAAAASVFLVVSYMRLVTGTSFTLRIVLPSQLIYLVLFSFSFFFEGYTGLTISIGAVITLFVLMQMTGRVDWARIFRTGEAVASRPVQ